jgi:serine/threonine protein kinase
MKQIQHVPNSIDSYTLVQMLKPARKRGEVSVGLYAAPDGTQVIIKYLNYLWQNSAYYQLLNEVKVTRLLESVKSSLRYPHIYQVIQNPNIIYLIREYIPGEPIRNSTSEMAKKIIDDVLAELRRVNSGLSITQKYVLSKRSPIQIILTLPIYFIMALIRNMSMIHIYRKLIVVFYQHYSFTKLFQPIYTLAHRDLTPDNILVCQKKIAVIDTEVCMLAEIESDVVVAVREFYSKIGLDGIRELISKYIIHDQQKRNFIGLSSYYLLQSFATMDMTDDGYRRDSDYARIFINKLLPNLT